MLIVIYYHKEKIKEEIMKKAFLFVIAMVLCSEQTAKNLMELCC